MHGRQTAYKIWIRAKVDSNPFFRTKAASQGLDYALFAWSFPFKYWNLKIKDSHYQTFQLVLRIVSRIGCKTCAQGKLTQVYNMHGLSEDEKLGVRFLPPSSLKVCVREGPANGGNLLEYIWAELLWFIAAPIRQFIAELNPTLWQLAKNKRETICTLPTPYKYWYS